MDIKKQLETVVETLIDDIKLSIENEIRETASSEIIEKIVSDKLDQAIESAVTRKLREMLEIGNLPQQSISHQCIDFTNFKITGDVINGGIVKNFGCTGIEDRTNSVQLTLLDAATVIENNLIATSAEIKGTLTVQGDLLVKGEIPTDSKTFQNLVSYSVAAVKGNLDSALFEGYADLVSDKIKTAGLDLDMITQGGKSVVNGNQLGYHITDTNIQRVGMIKDLQSTGETLLSSTLYVTKKRAGINTLDPSAAFVVWDEEVEMLVCKRKQDEGYVGTSRPQKVVLGSNKKENCILDTDGSVQINDLRIGKIKITSSSSVPNYNGQLGQIVFNENPSLGGPMGWVCLGATRWANFGVID